MFAVQEALEPDRVSEAQQSPKDCRQQQQPASGATGLPTPYPQFAQVGQLRARAPQQQPSAAGLHNVSSAGAGRTQEEADADAGSPPFSHFSQGPPTMKAAPSRRQSAATTPPPFSFVKEEPEQYEAGRSAADAAAPRPLGSFAAKGAREMQPPTPAQPKQGSLASFLIAKPPLVIKGTLLAWWF